MTQMAQMPINIYIYINIPYMEYLVHVLPSHACYTGPFPDDKYWQVLVQVVAPWPPIAPVSMIISKHFPTPELQQRPRLEQIREDRFLEMEKQNLGTDLCMDNLTGPQWSAADD